MKRCAGVRLAGCGHHAPVRKIDNTELETILGLEPGWILRRTGIASRRWASDDETLSSLAVPAAEMALAGLDRDRIGLVLLATSTPEQKLPPTAPLLTHRLGLSQAGCIDLAGACAGFLHAWALADGYVRTHGKAVLLIGANILSRRIDITDRNSAVLFADAAGAVALWPSDDSRQGILGLDLDSDGAGYDLVRIAPGGTTMQIADGRALFVEAVRMMTDCSLRALADAGLTIDSITRLVPHQANARIFDLVCQNLGLAPERVVRSIEHFGNSSAATIPLSLSQSAALQPLQPGERLLLAAAGAGLIGGAAIIGM